MPEPPSAYNRVDHSPKTGSWPDRSDPAGIGAGLPGAENGVVIFKILRNALDAPDRGKVCIVGRNPDAIWFDDYEDRVIFDEAGLYDYARVDRKKIESEEPLAMAAR